MGSTDDAQVAADAFAPPLADVEAKPDPTGLAGPWRRWLARNVDQSWQVALLVGAMWVVSRVASIGPLLTVSEKGQGQLFYALLLPIALFIDALAHRLFGNTPGKMLLGVRVTSPEGETLSFGRHLRRNLGVWFSGFGLGIPIVTLITLVRQHKRVKAGEPASYDAASGIRVAAQPIGAARVVLGVVLYLGGMAFVFAMNYDAASLQTLTRSRGDLPAQTWRNPETERETVIEGFWNPTRSGDPAGVVVTTFSEPLDRAAVVLIRELAPGFTLEDYVDALRTATAGSMEYDNPGSTFEKFGRPAWTCRGNVLSTAPSRFDVTIVQYDDAFWRVTKVQTAPVGSTNGITNSLCADLWETVE